MIVKKVKYTDTNKTKVWQNGDLVDYIRYPHNTNPQEKIAHFSLAKPCPRRHVSVPFFGRTILSSSVAERVAVNH